MSSLPNTATITAWRTFLEAHVRITERLGAELQLERGLPLSWYDVLVQLQEAPGSRLRMTELAGAVLLSKSGLTRLVDRMNADGMVERCPDPGDRRGTFVQLTPAGFERLREAAPVHLRGVQHHFGQHLSDVEARALAVTLGKVISGLAGSHTTAAQFVTDSA
ncbi:MAG: MarR family transcriptional regulator [Anaerolineaceae bacterium]